MLPPGGAEVDIAVLFADVRGSTELGEGMGAGAFAAMLNRFYATASRALLDHKAMIDKMVGDEVMALFIPGPTGPDYRRDAVRSAADLMRKMGYGKGEPWLPLGIGVHAGPAYVGKVGTSDIHDFTALGDTVNTAARLQAEAQPGEVIISEELYADVASRFPDLERRSLEVKDKAEPIAVRVLHAAEA